MELFEEARIYAQAMHMFQKYGTDPYHVHLDEVVAILVEFGHTDGVMRAAGYLHDIVEDTPITLEDLRKLFPEDVVYLVDGVTSEPGANRKIRIAATLPKTAQHIRRVVLKLADRIANVRRSLRDKSDLLTMYIKEYPVFRAALYTEDQLVAPMWKELDQLINGSRH